MAKNILDPKNILTRKIFWPKKYLGPKSMLDPKIFLGQKLTYGQKFFDPKNLLRSKNIFDPEIIFEPKNYCWTKEDIFDSNYILTHKKNNVCFFPKHFENHKFWTQNYFLAQIILPQPQLQLQLGFIVRLYLSALIKYFNLFKTPHEQY